MGSVGNIKQCMSESEFFGVKNEFQKTKDKIVISTFGGRDLLLLII